MGADFRSVNAAAATAVDGHHLQASTSTETRGDADTRTPAGRDYVPGECTGHLLLFALAIISIVDLNAILPGILTFMTGLFPVRAEESFPLSKKGARVLATSSAQSSQQTGKSSEILAKVGDGKGKAAAFVPRKVQLNAENVESRAKCVRIYFILSSHSF